MRHDFVNVMPDTICTIGLFNTIHVHCIIAFTLALDIFFFELFVLAATGFGLEILASFIRLFACGCGPFTLSTGDFRVLDHSIRRSLSAFFDLFFLFFGFFGSVLISISG
jgi:hypothetical protein